MKNLVINFIVLLTLVLMITCTGKKAESPIKAAEKQNEARFEDEQEDDAKKIAEAGIDNTYEIMLADTAFDKGASMEVKQLGEHLKKMHLKMNSELLALAAKKNIAIPADLTKSQKRCMLHMSRKHGLNFDKELVKYLRNTHEDAVNLYTELNEDSKDPDVKMFASKALTEVQQHLTDIEVCWEKIKDRKPPKTGVDHGDLR
jgi:putative membrane protein